MLTQLIHFTCRILRFSVRTEASPNFAYGVLIALFVVCPLATQAQSPSDAARAELKGFIENVTQATGRRYAAVDSAGHKIDTAKIIADPSGGYMAVYHTNGTNNAVCIFLATSTDILNWTFRKELFCDGSQPTLVSLSNGGFILAFEYELDRHIVLKYYSSRANLLNAVASRSFDAPRSLSPCAEGTPNIYSVSLNPDIDHSTIDVGGHFYSNCQADRQMRGIVTNFNSWSVSAQPAFDNALLHWNVQGNIGDRDAGSYKGYRFGLIEGQFTVGDWASWRSYIYDYQTGNAEPLNVHTDGGSTAFGNPTITFTKDPNGQDAVIATLFLFSQGAAAGEEGELIFYRTLGTSGGVLFSSGLESGQSQPTWINTVETANGGRINVGGYCCGLTAPELGTRNETSHGGSTALMYSGADSSASTSYAYMKVFDVNISVASSTTLSYWIYPQSSSQAAGVSGSNSSCVAVDLVFTDGTNLRSTGIVDQTGDRMHPAYQCGRLTLNQWNQVTANIGALNGKVIDRIVVAYDQPANTGGYRGYVDDISLTNP